MNASLPASLVAIAIGASLGAWLRWGLGLWLNTGEGRWPWGTFAANAIGGLLIGVALSYVAVRPELSPLWRLAIITGFLGGLTTFSTFSAEVTDLLMGGAPLSGLGLAALHLLTSLSLTAVGTKLYRFE